MSDDQNILISSQVVDIAEHPEYIELVNRVCYYNAPNYNGSQLNYDESSLEKARTLIDMPVVAKYCVDSDGNPTFTGHELRKVNGEYQFGTEAIGTHTDVEIKEDVVHTVDGAEVTLPCLFAKQRIWTRFKNATSAVMRLYSENRLHNSWELAVNAYTYNNGVKYITDYTFLANCFLGLSSPAYGESAKVISLSDESSEDYLMVAEALTKDIASMSASNNNTDRREDIGVEIVTIEKNHNEISNDIDNNIDNNDEIEHVEITEENVDAPEMDETKGYEATKTIEESSITIQDIYMMARDALRDRDCHIAFIFPEEHILLVHDYSGKELDFIKFEYRIENNTMILNGEERVSLIVSPIQINAEISKLTDYLVKANKSIESLKEEVVELQKYKDELDKIKENAEKAKKENEIAELKVYIESSGCFSQAELEDKDIVAKINALDTMWFKSEIADRLMAKINSSSGKKHEVAGTKENVSIVLCNNNEATSDDVMKAFFGR